ncbi:MAG: autorepressor SdpR family transcription factor [Olsenella sp.]|nr:autorepressor SdpR family transcription factor [Olsenella sp.]MCI1289242.1 autorepressor SdpR family transcription factor [Olsenella sp.]
MGDAFKALGDPTRRRILELLSDGDMTAGQIADNFQMSKPSVSNHLGVLKAAGLVTSKRSGQNVIYHLNTTVFQDIMKWLVDVSQASGREG